MILRPSLYHRIRADRRTIAERVRRKLHLRFGRAASWTEGDIGLIADTVDFAVSLSTRALLDHEELPEDFLASCAAIGEAAGRFRRPPGEVQSYAEVVALLIQTEVWQRAEPGEHMALAAYAAVVDRLVTRAGAHIVETYFAQLRRDGFGAGDGPQLGRALLAGWATDDMLWAAGYRPAVRYRVVVVSPGPDTDGPSALGDLARQRPQVIQVPLAHDTVLIEPADLDAAEEEAGGPGVADLLDADARLSDAAMAVEEADGIRAVPAAVGSAQDAIAQIRTLRRSGRVCSRNELILESRLLADRRNSQRLRAVIRRLDDEPELVRTLLMLYADNLDRTRTARDLGIARRTLAYRTQRIRELTGMSPTGPRAVQVLGLGVSAQRVWDG